MRWCAGAIVAIVVGCGGGAEPAATVPTRMIELHGTGDLDGDGIIDANDECIDHPEDFDGFEDEDGCPDEDVSDHEFIPDLDDECARVPTCDQFVDTDGCPDSVVWFAAGSIALNPAAHADLDAVAAEVLGGGSIVQVRGSSAIDEPDALALLRAAAVRDALILRGVPPGILMIDAAPGGGPVVAFAADC